MKNSINVYDHQTLKELWELFSSAIKPASNSDTTTGMSHEPQHEEKESTQKVENGAKEDGATCELNEADTSEITVKSKHKKKKHKREKEIEVDPSTDLNDDDTSQAAESASSHEKKRKKKKHQLSTTNSNDETLREATEDKLFVNPPEDRGPLVTCELGMELIPVEKKKKRKKSKMEELVTDEKPLVENIISSKAGSEVETGPVEVALEYINGCQLHGEEERDLESDGKGKRKKKEKKHRRTEEGSDGDAGFVSSKKIKREGKEKLKKHKRTH